jgi:uncharacterized protein (DUF427 family)
MKALVGETVVAEAANDEVVVVEGNAYFPPEAVTSGVLRDSPTPYTCPWKGTAQYHDVLVDGDVLEDGAWSYPHLTGFATAHVGRDFSGYVAFDPRLVWIEP